LPFTQIADAVCRLVWHQGWIRRRGGQPADGSETDIDQRLVREMMRRLLARDGRALTQRREGNTCFIGSCRDTAVLACSLLRHQHVPARVRVGFAGYFRPGFFADHWLCEYWDGQSWRLLDAQLDDLEVSRYGISFEPWDVPHDAFFTAGGAWQAIRSGAVSEANFGVSRFGVSGAWFVGSSILRDLAALNK
jgi:hypothetical protein